MSGRPLVERMRSQREAWVELEDGLAVRLRRPSELRLMEVRSLLGPAEVRRAAVDWRGFSEATFLGKAIASSDPIEFDVDAFMDWLEDRVDLLGVCMSHLTKVSSEHVQRRADEKKSSLSTLIATPTPRVE